MERKTKKQLYMSPAEMRKGQLEGLAGPLDNITILYVFLQLFIIYLSKTVNLSPTFATKNI